MKSEFWLSTMGKIIRWIIFLPVATIAALIAGPIVYLINWLTGETSQWAIVSSATISQLLIIYISWYIVPNFKRVILFLIFGIRVIFSIIWFIYPSTSPLSLIMLIVQEIIVLGSSLY